MKKAKIVFYISITCFCISGATILVIPFIDNYTTPFKITIGIIFWLFLFLGCLLFFTLPTPKLNRRTNKVNDQIFVRGRPIFLTFGRNLYALIFDGVFLLSIVANIIFIFIRAPQIVQSIGIFLLLFSTEMHLVFNSNRYKKIIDLNKQNFGGKI